MLHLLAATLLLATGTAVVAATPVGAAITYVVNSTGTEGDANLADGSCRTAVNSCTLRAALAQDAADGTATRIEFNIPGSGPFQIPLSAGTYAVNDPLGGTVIDGYTQPGAAPNSDPVISNAIVKIQIVGSGNAGPNAFDVTGEQHHPRPCHPKRTDCDSARRTCGIRKPHRRQLHRDRPGGHLPPDRVRHVGHGRAARRSGFEQPNRLACSG